MKSLAILKTYFGYRSGQSIGDFAKEVKELTPAEKAELTRLAAEQLHVEVEE